MQVDTDFAGMNLQGKILGGKIAEKARSLSILSKACLVAKIAQKIEETADARDQLLNITSRLKTMIKEIKNEINSLNKDKQLYYSSAEKMTGNVGKVGGAAEKEIMKQKESICTIGEEIKSINQKNDSLKQQIDGEQKLVTELNDIIKKMKFETQEKAKECAKLKKEIVLSEKQLLQLKQKSQKYVIIAIIYEKYR